MHSPALRALLILLALVFAVGCSGPTRTAGTAGANKKDLAVLSLAQLPAGDIPIQIKSVQFDGQGDHYDIGKSSRDFYLEPGDHTGTFTFTAKVPDLGGLSGVPGFASLAKWAIPKDITIPGPKEIPLGAVTAGKNYEFAPPTAESLDNMLQNGGSFSLVRDKAK